MFLIVGSHQKETLVDGVRNSILKVDDIEQLIEEVGSGESSDMRPEKPDEGKGETGSTYQGLSLRPPEASPLKRLKSGIIQFEQEQQLPVVSSEETS